MMEIPIQNKEIFALDFPKASWSSKGRGRWRLSSIVFKTLYRYISSRKEYIRRSKIPQVNCLCPVWHNIELLLTGIKKNVTHSKKLSWFARKIASDPVTQTCIDKNVTQLLRHTDKKYTSCVSLDMEAINDREKISYYTWKKEASIMKKFLVKTTKYH